MVKTVVNDLSGASLDFADVDENSSDRIDPAAENKICDVISTGSVTSDCFRAECREVFVAGPAWNKQPARGRELKTFADRQKHDGAILSEARGIRSECAHL